MSDFSSACQTARAAYQAAMNSYYAARDAHVHAQSVLRSATDALRDAQRALTQAQNASRAADAAWDAHVAAIKADPSLAVPTVETGVLPPTAPPAGAAVAGPIQSRTPPNFSIWAAGIPTDLSRWQTAADRALQRAVVLKAAADQARTALNAKTAQHATSAAAEATARAAELTARAARTAASNAAVAERAKVHTACAGQHTSHPLGGGGEIVVDPGVLPDDETKVRRRLESLPEKEKRGIHKVEMGDDVKKDPDTGQTEWTAGEYAIGAQTIHLYILGHTEKTMKHEVGHHVYFHRMTEAARDRWKRFFQQGTNGQVVPTGKMPTQYATTDEAEGFAEAYEFLRDNKPLDPAVKQLLEDLVGGLS